MESILIKASRVYNTWATFHRVSTYQKNGRTKYRSTTINITDMKFNTKNELDTITFEWYPVDGELDHIYTYKANVGLVETRRP